MHSRALRHQVDPELARFIQVGRFAHNQLNDAGFAFGDLVALRAAPPPEPPELDAHHPASTNEKQWRLAQVLTVAEPSGADGGVVRRVYETVRWRTHAQRDFL
jgi:hypothetical protein